MQAYAILDGGGIKGAALAGALKAAWDENIEFVGYGGTSAGSIIALLATLGYNGDELEQVMTEELPLKELAQDLKPALKSMQKIVATLSSPGLLTGPKLWFHKSVFESLSKDLGFCSGAKLTESLLKLCVRKHGNLLPGFTFQDLAKLKCPALKIVASDLRGRKPLVFSNCGGDELGGSVIDAVRASMSYPFAFKPVKFNDHLLVDGGLCSNLPVFLFDKERDADRIPLLAFDLVPEPATTSNTSDLGGFCRDMLETGLEAGDYLMRRSTPDIHHVRIRVPHDISPLDFDLSKSRLKELFNSGRADTHEYLRKELAVWQQAENKIEGLQARHGSPTDVCFVLQRFAVHLQSDTRLTNVRTHVMLPLPSKRRVVAYQYNMDQDPDQDLELAGDGGCSGKCWTTKAPTYADLADAGTGDNHVKWNMTRQEQAKIRRDRKTMLSIPIFSPGSNVHLIGVLSADSDANLSVELDEAHLEAAFDIGQKWAVVLSAVLA